ncbi:MAG TPA: hypothetical protein VFF79_09530 [Conexibacter sp.]|jgi:hypothetical protein|nr:hypothetical protein [Conexibacter sp.]
MNDPGARRRVGVRERRDPGAGWRSHTFSDGVCSITLTTALDAGAAERLRGRLRELRERGCDRLIVDVTAAVQPGARAPGLLAAVFQEHTSSCEVVVVTARGSVLDGLLPARVAVAWSLSDARRLLALLPERHSGRARPAPAGAIGAEDRHTLAVRQALRWAAQTAGRGDYDNALRGLATIERVEGALPDDWEERRQVWLAASREQAARRPRRRLVLRQPGLGSHGG